MTTKPEYSKCQGFLPSVKGVSLCVHTKKQREKRPHLYERKTMKRGEKQDKEMKYLASSEFSQGLSRHKKKKKKSHAHIHVSIASWLTANVNVCRKLTQTEQTAQKSKYTWHGFCPN